VTIGWVGAAILFLTVLFPSEPERLDHSQNKPAVA
jgi:hypothetical protein